MLTLALIGVLTSVATEVINWLNLKLNKTVLHGRASFLLALIVSLIVASTKVLASGNANWQMLGTTFSEIWTSAQVFFILIVETLKLDVQEKKTT